MEAFARQQFDVLLGGAIASYVERLEQRCGGPVPALARLREDPNGVGVWLDEFIDALFRDTLVDNAAGACWVLQALGRRPTPPVPATGTIDAALGVMARAAFREVLRLKSEETLEQRLAFQVTD